MTPEQKVKKRISTILNELGAWHFMPSSGVYGKKGVSDYIACLRGRFVAIEAKRGSEWATELQQHLLGKVGLCGGFAACVNEDNVGHLKEALQSWMENEPSDKLKMLGPWTLPKT